MIETINAFSEKPLASAASDLFKALNIPINELNIEGGINDFVLPEITIKQTDKIGQVTLLGSVDDKVFENEKSEFNYLKVMQESQKYDGLILFTIELNEDKPTRSFLAEVTRGLNRSFHTSPVVVIFKYGDYISLANTERVAYQQKWREGEKVGKVSLLRDISIHNPHTGHLKILLDLRIARSGSNEADTYEGLYQYWKIVFDVNILNKSFYKELSNWYFWAIKHVRFPGEPTAEDALRKKSKHTELLQEHRATNVIRMLTRLLFVWFIKEKGLIPNELFDLQALQNDILKDINPYHETGLFTDANLESVYYKAILQNLFFATLNCPINGDSHDNRSRGFRGDGYGTHRGIDYLMRYKKHFKNPEMFLKLMNSVVPFLNGGLFECLDDKFNHSYIDGFSDQMTKGETLVVPDYIFFGVEEKVDLSEEYGIKNKSAKEAAVKGLINILKSYKFTINENTPIEEDVALDPELLGKVFENLLASYNPETKTTARKQTGSFYTPREIVNYMVDESLIAYLKNAITNWGGLDDETLDKELHVLTSFDSKVPFADNAELQREIITALSTCTILDPACGSGAFPMGILQKMVHILQKLDPENKVWKEVQLEKARKESEAAFEIEDKQAREERLLEINEAFDQSINDPDYARKLFLIENCIYGVDIQPIATQISKLRFFISLVVEQKVNSEKNNFGIRPLPNLETKFVAANTLIGIKKDGGLFETDEVKKLENELKIVRHKIFSLKSKERKIAWREKDKVLREKLSAVLKNQGLPLDAAEKLAKWDPYDQNASSPFFDTEWMFGIKVGFDVVIGNPPYKILTKNNTSDWELKYYLKEFDSIKKSSSKNLYTLFIEKGVYLIKKEAILSYIVPEGLFTTRSYSGCVEVMEKYGSPTQIITFSDYVFENAVTGNVIFLYSKKKGLKVNRLHFNKEYTLSEKVENSKIEISEIQKGTVPLKDISTTFKGMVVKDRNDFLSTERNKDVFLLGKNISKWRIDSCLYTDYDSLTIIGGTKKLSKHQVSPRILVRRTGDSLCCAYLKTPALTESTLYSTWSTNQFFSNLYLFGLLNSTLLNHYNKVENITNQQGFPQILMTDLELLPIKEPRKNESNIVELFSLILIHKLNSAIESVLNAVVFNIYFPDHMKDRGIDVLEFVEQDIDEVMQGRVFENLNDAEKEQVIEALHTKWSHPDNEVIKRIKSFKEKSPEILKPILEA